MTQWKIHMQREGLTTRSTFTISPYLLLLSKFLFESELFLVQLLLAAKLLLLADLIALGKYSVMSWDLITVPTSISCRQNKTEQWFRLICEMQTGFQITWSHMVTWSHLARTDHIWLYRGKNGQNFLKI